MGCFYENGLEFSCKRCSACCGKTPGVVYLSRQDLSLLAEFHKTSEAEFISRYCRWVMYYGGIEVLALFEEKIMTAFYGTMNARLTKQDLFSAARGLSGAG